MISGMTALRTDDAPTARDRWSYILLAEELRRIVSEPKADARELFRRMCFNALISNTDDHPRNHAFIALDRNWRLSPAYDLIPVSYTHLDVYKRQVLTMNTRAATLFEGIANNAILIAHDVTEIEQLPDEDAQIGLLLALLQDDAKNQSSYLTWGEKRPQPEVATVLRSDFLVTEERADKLSGAWGSHPLLGLSLIHI